MSKLPTTIEELSAPSEYLQEVLVTPPRWIIRWGELLLLILVLILLLLGWLIRYPDRISASVVITTPNPPIEIIAQADGALTYLPVDDHDSVTKGTLLAVIHSTAHYKDVIELQKKLDRLKVTDLSWVLADTLFTKAYQLGQIQEPYAQMRQAQQNYALYLQLAPHYQERLAVEGQLSRYQALLRQRGQQQQLLARKVTLAEKDYHRNEQLHASGTIADKALEDSEQEWLEVRDNYETKLAELAQIRVQIADLQREWQQSNTEHTQEGEQLRMALLRALDNLRSAVAQWEQYYVLKAPMAGMVSFFDFWSEQQYVQTGQTVMSIVPQEAQQVIGQLRVPVRNFGKVAIGQQVKVYLDNYPYEEYGTLQGRVENLSDLPQQGYYSVVIAFSGKLTTQYGKSIPFQQQLSGQAEIITEERRLLERIFNRVKSSLDSF